MGAQDQLESGSRQGRKLTLGDVLYNDKTIPQESEEAWAGIVRAVAARDAQALHSLYERTNRLVYTLALRITGSPEAAEEMTLQVFYDVWTNAATYRADGGTVLGWIMNQARSRSLERARREKLAPGASRSSQFEERSRLVQEALRELTPEERKAMEAAYLQSTYNDGPARLELRPGAFRSWIRSGLMKLRHALAGNS